ncbi:MAG: type II toxin-antitoxin system HicA family toxin [Candidatus Levyibacteriota bacterium]
MSKLPRDIKPKQLIIILERLGFTVVGKRGSHHRLVHADADSCPSQTNSPRHSQRYPSSDRNANGRICKASR